MADPEDVHVQVEDATRSRASSAGSTSSRQLGPVRTGRETPPGESRSSSRAAESDIEDMPLSVRQINPLPPIGQTGEAAQEDEHGSEAESVSIPVVEATSSVIESTMAADSKPSSARSSSRQSRYPRVVSYRRELDPDEVSVKSDDSTSTSLNNTGVTARSRAGTSQAGSPRGGAEDAVLLKRTFDGQEVTLVSVECQTDWSLFDEESAPKPMTKRVSVQQPTTSHARELSAKSLRTEDPVDQTALSRGRLVSPVSSATSGKKSSRRGSSVRVTKSVEGGRSLLSEQASEPAIPHPSREDEYGIPLLQLSSSDSSDDDSDEEESNTKSDPKGKSANTLPSIGPPQILQYQRESDKKDLPVDMDALHNQDMGPGSEQGAFGGVCEFCGKNIKPFPTVSQQRMVPPEELYCCPEYREFIEFLMMHPLHEEANKDEDIDVAPHAPHGTQMERSAAKERAVQRMRERELARQQAAIATGMPSMGGGQGQGALNFYQQLANSSNHHFTLDGGQSVDQLGLPIRHADKRPLEGCNFGSNSSQPLSGMSLAVLGQNPEDGEFPDLRLALDNIQEEGYQGNLQLLLGDIPELDTTGAGNSGVQGKGGKSRAQKYSQGGNTTRRIPPKKKISSAGTDMTSNSYSNVGRFDVAKQMKTINFQLSSVKCLEEGWTLRPPSPLENEVTETEIFEPEPILPPWAQAQGKGRKIPGLIQRFYEDGKLFLLLFPDGSGNVFYPSGHIAISIICQEPGLNSYLVYEDNEPIDPEEPPPLPKLLGVFDPDGHATTYHQSGIVRICLDPIGGLELDTQGARKRRWSWKDQVQHVHAPPIQPITFAVTQRLAVRIMAQDNITLTFTHRTHSCRFQVGARLKLVSPENLPAPEVDEDQLFREEVKTKIESTLSRVSNLLKFPKSPKLDKLPAPAHLSARVAKTERMRELTRELTSSRLKNKKSPVVKVN